MPFNRGDVVLVKFPYSDLKRYKKRPALVIQSDTISPGHSDKIIIEITSNTSLIGPTRVLVYLSSSEGKSMGILKDSVIVTDKIVTIESYMIDKKIGSISSIMTLVDTALRVTLNL